jgi:hypothetical protein
MIEQDLDKVAGELEDLKLVDNGNLLKQGGRREVLDAIDRWKSDHGLQAYVLLRPEGDPVEAWRPLWGMMKLDDKTDLLLVFNGRRWEARGWGLTFKEVKPALASAEPDLKIYYGKGLSHALDALGAASTHDTRPTTSHSHLLGIGLAGGVGALALLGGFALVVRRRNKLRGEAQTAFDAAHSSAEKAFSEVTLAAENLTPDEASKLQLRVAELKKRLDSVVEEARGKPALMSDPVTLGKIRQLENEIQAVRSTYLQKAR